MAQGYIFVRKHLFEELNRLTQPDDKPLPDDRMYHQVKVRAEAVVAHLASNLLHAVQYHQALKAHRTI